MKKRVLAILMATVMSLALVACGGGKEEAPAEAPVKSETAETPAKSEAEEEAAYTDEQMALAEEFDAMVEEYNAAIEVLEANPEILEQEEGLADTVNELTAAIEEAKEWFADPELLTAEVMDGLKNAMAETYKFIDEVNTAAGISGDVETSEYAKELASVLTIAFGGVDEDENTYYFISDEEITEAAYVALSADMTQNVKCIGKVVENEDGSLTIKDEEGYETTFTAEAVDGGMILTLQNGVEVAMVPWDAAEIIELVLTIGANTENINE